MKTYYLIYQSGGVLKEINTIILISSRDVDFINAHLDNGYYLVTNQELQQRKKELNL